MDSEYLIKLYESKIAAIRLLYLNNRKHNNPALDCDNLQFYKRKLNELIDAKQYLISKYKQDVLEHETKVMEIELYLLEIKED